MSMGTPSNEPASSAGIPWPDGQAEPPKPRVLVGMKAVGFYVFNLAILALIAAPVLIPARLASQGLDCFLHQHEGDEGWLLMRMSSGLGIALIFIVCLVAVSLVASVCMYRKWINRFGWDEFSGYLFHDRWQRMGRLGQNLNALLLRQARK